MPDPKIPDLTESDLDTAGVLDRMLGPGRDTSPDPDPKPADPAPADPKPADPAPADAAILESMAAALGGPVVDPPPAAPARPDAMAAIDAVELPPHARPNTAEAFTKVKEAARSHINRLTAELDAARQEVEKAKTAAPDPSKVISPELEQELRDLRAFREAAAHREDPAFKAKFETPVKEAEARIEDMLRAQGASDEAINNVRKVGFGKFDWDPVIRTLSPGDRRTLDVLLTRHADAELARTDASKRGEKFVAEFAKETAAQREKEAAQAKEAVATHFQRVADSIPVLSARPIPPDAPPATRESIARVNEFIARNRADAQAALLSGRPEDIATLTAAAAASVVYRVQYESVNAINLRLRGEIGKLRGALDAVTKGARPGTPRNPVPTPTPAPKNDLPIGASVDDALKAYTASRQAP